MTAQSASSSALFLGLDCSTQSLKASLLSASLELVAEAAINFEAHLPHFGTRAGVHTAPGGQVHSPAALLLEAFDMLFEKIKAEQWNLGDVRGVSASGQQHATVYWTHGSSDLLAGLDASQPLASQLRAAFSRDVIPNWQDASTGSECAAFEAAVGGAEALARITGSSSHTRFSGPQIMRFRSSDPKAWAATGHIGLVSSALTTLLTQAHQGIDESDACGMNLWDLSTPQRGWNATLLETTAGSADEAARLAKMLGPVESDAGRVVGTIGAWFVERYGFSKECIVCPGTGDNPATFLSFALPPQHAVLSMGTSDTVLTSSDAYVPDVNTHTFVHPGLCAPPNAGELEAGLRREGDGHDAAVRYMTMLCYKNGSLAREAVRDELGGGWAEFDKAVLDAREAAAGVPKRAAWYWRMPEIIPKGAHGTVRYELAAHGEASRVESFPDSIDALAILEQQFLSYRFRTAQISAPGTPAASVPPLLAVHAVGGASNNAAIRTVAADALGAPILRAKQAGNACSMGAAYKACWAWTRHSQQRWVPFDTCVREARAQEDYEVVARPEERHAKRYTAALEAWAELEKRAVQEAKA